MHLALPMPKRKTLLEQVWPAGLAVVLVVAGALLIPVRYPVEVSNGSITPAVARGGDKGEVKWDQDWRELCSVTVTREFVGADGFRKTSAPYLLQPPKQTGIATYRGPIVIPDLPVGDAYYHSLIQPHCWIDSIWPRSYRTPEIRLTMLPPAPPGPR